uniref:cysteine--tRNA ligase n=1 Tax=Davidia involucrata TaxID=16924 RepID=A0A5B7A8C2_DAVIN
MEELEGMVTESLEKQLYLKESPKDEGLYIYNTITGEKELFKPKVAGKVAMYFCGITPYDESHVGHARSMVAFDILYRYFQYLGYNVTYVRNFTDVDDKIIHRATELNKDILTVSSRYSQKFLDDMNDLQCLPPTHEPRVSEHIDQIIDMINQIISNDCAYTVDGNVYFSIDKFPNYGRLSRRKLEENIPGKRVDVDFRKQNPADFALWKAAKTGEPSWDSPWGPGRPGWHIECSAMSSQYLTFTFDIHGGGQDLIFPHHENEIAQSWAACSDSNVTYWMHIGSANLNGEKMSKSKGNFISIREALEWYHPLALRHFLMSMHYRSPINLLKPQLKKASSPVNFSMTQLENASNSVFYIYQTLQDCEVAISQFWEGSLKEGAESDVKRGGITVDAQNCINGLHGDFHTKMLDDFQTPPILSAALPEALKFVNKCLSQIKKQQKQQGLSLIRSLIEIEKELKEVLNILGLLSPLSYSKVLGELKDKALKRADLEEEKVLKLIKEREEARKERDFSRGDQIRRDLAARGIALMDLGTETIWRPCVPE